MPKTVVATDFYGHSHEIDIKDLRWRPSAYGIVVKDGAVLIVRQKNGYDLPGGGVELGETLEEALIREVKEESGIDVTHPILLYATSSYFKPVVTDESVFQSVMLYYSCEFVGGELSNEGFDEGEKIYAEAPEWLPLDKLDDIKLGTSTDFRSLIKQVAAAQS